MIKKEDLEAGLHSVAADMEQLKANYNVLLGQQSTLNTLLQKFAPGVSEMAEGIADVIDGVGDIAEGMADVVAEI